jgi:transcriptional regulator with XRE-family HTH domain
VAVDGAVIRERRKGRGLTVTALALGCQISKQYVSKIERGDRARVSPPVLARIGAALGVDIDSLRLAA